MDAAEVCCPCRTWSKGKYYFVVFLLKKWKIADFFSPLFRLLSSVQHMFSPYFFEAIKSLMRTSRQPVIKEDSKENEKEIITTCRCIVQFMKRSILRQSAWEFVRFIFSDIFCCFPGWMQASSISEWRRRQLDGRGTKEEPTETVVRKLVPSTLGGTRKTLRNFLSRHINHKVTLSPDKVRGIISFPDLRPSTRVE